MPHDEDGALTVEYRMSKLKRTLPALLLAAAVLGASCAGKVEVRPPGPELPPVGFIRGTLSPDNTLTVSMAGALVRMDNVAVQAGKGGSYALPQPLPGKHYLVAEKRFASGAVRRVLGVAMVYVADNPIELKIRMRDATNVDTFCSDCHPTAKNVTRRDQIVRDVHPSGIVPVKASKPTGKYDETGRVTCESCHTVHQPTGTPRFTLAPFRDGKLCLQCH